MCLRLLAARARTRAELAGQLAKRGYADDVSERVLDRLTEVGLIDDRDFAEQLVADRLRREKLTDEPGEDVKLSRRLVGMLARRGYGQTLAFDVVKVALASERERRRV